MKSIVYTLYVSICLMVTTLNCAYGQSSDEAKNCTLCETSTRSPTGKPESANGCGPGMLSKPVNIFLNQNARDCCNGHDHCYNNCKMDKMTCDLQFQDCLAKKGVNKLLNYAFPKAVINWGCSAYLAAQKDTCRCDDPGENEDEWDMA